MVDEIPDSRSIDKDEKVVTTAELIQHDFGPILAALSDISGIRLNPDMIAEFCESKRINSPRQFVCQLINVLMQRLNEKIHEPNITYFRMPIWLDEIVERVSTEPETAQKLKNLIPIIPETETSPEYEILAYGFLRVRTSNLSN